MINRQSASSRYRSPVEISIRSSSRGPDADKLEFLLAPGEGHFRWGRRSARLALYRERLLICAASPPAERSKGDLGGRVGENPAVRADAPHADGRIIEGRRPGLLATLGLTVKSGARAIPWRTDRQNPRARRGLEHREFMLSPGQADDPACAQTLIENVDSMALIGDKARNFLAGIQRASAIMLRN